MESPINWLLESNQPATRYRALTELLDRSEKDPEVQKVFSEIPKRGWAREILDEQLPGFRVQGKWQFQGYWHNYVYLNRPKYVTTVWKFLVLIDLGLTAKNDQVRKTCELLSDRYVSLKENYHLCMTANLSRAFLKAGFDKNDRVRRALDWLVSEQKEDGGWHCFESKKGTLDCWEPLSTFSALPKSRWSRKIKLSVERGAEFYLSRRLYREGSKKYSGWFRFHYPVHYYYDLLVGLDVITSLGYGRDPRIKFALDFLRKRQKSDGTWILDAVQPDIPKDLPETEYSFSPPFEPFPAIPFALEKIGKSSKMTTLRALNVLKRVEESS